MTRKKKSVVRCVVCGLAATQHVSVEPVCENIVCHGIVKEVIRATVTNEKNKMGERT